MRTNLSAPSMHTYLAFLKGLALSTISFITTPVNNAVETPAGPHEKPLDFRTTFCSFRLLPAHTNVIGYVTFSYSDNSSFNVIFNGFATNLSQLSALWPIADKATYPSTENSQSGISSS